MRIFASDRVRSIMQNLGMEKGEAIEHKMVTNAIEKAQRKVEGRNFDIRKQLLEYDDVANDQRQMIYAQRNELMELDDISETVNALWDDVVNQVTRPSLWRATPASRSPYSARSSAPTLINTWT